MLHTVFCFHNNKGTVVHLIMISTVLLLDLRVIILYI